MDNINLDFCIINNPINGEKMPIIFVTRKGEKHLDETILDEYDYKKLKQKIRDIGYVESIPLIFEFSQNKSISALPTNNIKKVLEKSGMNYSYEFESYINSNFEEFNKNEIKKNFI
jgi:hypothetical protein